jgi:microcystin-dependent protein
MELILNGRTTLALVALLSSISYAKYVSFVDAESAGGIAIEEATAEVGTIIMWGGSKIPENWIEVKGQSISQYPELVKIYGIKLPDLRGEFVRGWDNGRGVDAGRLLNSNQNEGLSGIGLSFKGNPLPAHAHEIYGGYKGGYSNTYANADAAGGNHSYKPNTYGASGGTPTGVIQGIGTETRPSNIALKYIVKAI